MEFRVHVLSSGMRFELTQCRAHTLKSHVWIRSNYVSVSGLGSEGWGNLNWFDRFKLVW